MKDHISREDAFELLKKIQQGFISYTACTYGRGSYEVVCR